LFIGRYTTKAYIPVDQAIESIDQNQIVANGQLDINTATAEQLQMIDGIGPEIARRIIDYRTTNGNFKTVEELMNINGIGEKNFKKIKPYIKITNE
jgi:competence protein ComEA